jgi:hypothetical protein
VTDPDRFKPQIEPHEYETQPSRRWSGSVSKIYARSSMTNFATCLPMRTL